MGQQKTYHQVAIASVANTLGEWWPGAVPAIDPVIQESAERLAVGTAPASSSSPPALRSIFSRLRGYAGEDRFLPRVELTLTADTLYPQPMDAVTGSFDHLKHKFAEAMTALAATSDPQAKLEGLLDALQRYAWCVPAPQYGDSSDVSLYDHTRITAALAVCLASGGDPAGEVALLGGGDLSGVQDWLYTLGSSGAAKSLRGRSFYLQLLTEVMAYKVLDDLGLPLTNLVYAGGGNFYVLAPVGDAERLSQLANEIGHTLLAAHEGDLFLAIGCTPIRASEFAVGQIGKAWSRVNETLGRQKRQRYANLGESVMARAIGAALNQGGSPDKVCSVCQRENPDGKPWPPDQNDSDIRKCDLCGSLEVLGNTLPDATHIIVSRLDHAVPVTKPISNWQDGLRALGYHVAVIDAGTAEGQPPPGVVYARIGRIQPKPDQNYDRSASFAYQDLPYAFAYRPLVSIVPRNQGAIATFDQLCQSATGIDRWGVLRMDVDDLGSVFREGFGDYATLTRTTQLSFALRLFFEGRLNEIGGRYNVAHVLTAPSGPGIVPGRDGVYAMYSGGDDLFIVGAWDALPHLAHDIRQEFARFVADNPLLTVSGGISLVSERFPLYQAARQAGRAEESAKDFKRSKGGHAKDALAFLGQVIAWEQFQAIWDRVARLQAWSEARPPKINRSLIQTLRAIDAEYQNGLKRQQRLRAEGRSAQVGQFYYGPWMWKLVYQLSRVAERAKRDHNEDVASWVENLRDALVEPAGPITNLGLTARWAEYLTRKREKEDRQRSRDEP